MADSLPSVLPKNHADLVESRLRNQAILKFGTHQLPDNLKDWEKYRDRLRAQIIDKAGVVFNPKLPLNMKETGSLQLKGYTIRNISFQTLPGMYATANLYIPDGKGPFPGIVLMAGHSTNGRFYNNYQSVGHTLALNGYVALAVDPWGAGERTTSHGISEYHGASLGASLMNIGESLMGMQISDNIRAVDLLSTLPFVDPAKIGATGASGGGNQTMWLAALDGRVKAAVPVVSVGTFESYVMRSNCICELLIDGLTFTEEAGVLALSRAIMPSNHIRDAPSFLPKEMLRSYENAKDVFAMLGAGHKISNRVFDLTHGYHTEDRKAMLGWFDLQLKGTGTGEAKEEQAFELIPEEKLMTFTKGQRDHGVMTTAAYCRLRGADLRSAYIGKDAFDAGLKRNELLNVLRINELPELKKAHRYVSQGGWDRFALETSDGKLIPILHLAPVNPSLGYMLVSNTGGKQSISPELIEGFKKKGQGIVLVDLSGTGELFSRAEIANNKSMVLHTLSRSELWLGKTLLGEWVKELGIVTDFLRSTYKAQSVIIDGNKESGLAGLFLAATGGNVSSVTMRDAPVSYLFDGRENIDFFSMAIHLPGFLNWGDVSLAAALGGKPVRILSPVTMSGEKIGGIKLQEYAAEFARIRKLSKQPGETSFGDQ
ncbi:MAG: dienelactone hydrolase family protein [Daejeonella sp.]